MYVLCKTYQLNLIYAWNLPIALQGFWGDLTPNCAHLLPDQKHQLLCYFHLAHSNCMLCGIVIFQVCAKMHPNNPSGLLTSHTLCEPCMSQNPNLQEQRHKASSLCMKRLTAGAEHREPISSTLGFPSPFHLQQSELLVYILLLRDECCWHSLSPPTVLGCAVRVLWWVDRLASLLWNQEWVGKIPHVVTSNNSRSAAGRRTHYSYMPGCFWEPWEAAGLFCWFYLPCLGSHSMVLLCCPFRNTRPALLNTANAHLIFLSALDTLCLGSSFLYWGKMDQFEFFAVNFPSKHMPMGVPAPPSDTAAPAVYLTPSVPLT